MKTPVIQSWVCDLNFMQQSVLLATIRGPDGVIKDHPAKVILRWFRRSILFSAFESARDKKPFVFDRPDTPGGGSFTGPTPLKYNSGWPNDRESGWPGLKSAADDYLRSLDEVPHHFQLHLMHAAEIVGYKHPDGSIREWWRWFYFRLANDMHLNPETIEQMDKRLGDSEQDWRAAEESVAL